MAPVASALAFLLAAASAVDAKTPALGHHAPPSIANILSHSRRAFSAVHARYYGTAHGLTRPPSLPEKRDTTVPAGWSYHGCITESYDERLLQGFAFTSRQQSPLLCLTECQKRGFPLAGMEYGDECYCGTEYKGSGGQPNPASYCSKPCSGDKSQICGNSWLLSLYNYNSSALPSCDPVTITTTLPSATTSANATIAPSVTSSANISASISPSITASVNATTSILPSANVTANVTVSMTATSSALPSPTGALYENEGDQSEWYTLGCAVDSANNRVLTGYVEIHLNDLTVDSCLTMCETKGFKYAGLEYGEECYCGNSLANSVTYSKSSCGMACKGDSTETCGGDWAIELYELFSTCDNTTTTGTVPSSSAVISSSVTASSTVSPTVSPIATSSATSTLGGVLAPTILPSSTTSTAPASSTSVPVSSDTHYVWAHHMVGNTYPYQVSNWLSDINKAYSYGIDGFALNMGSDYWQPARIKDAYDAAEQSGTSFKLFLSLDMTVLNCGSWSDASALVNIVSKYATHPNQAMIDGKVLVSTFAGSSCTFGTGSMNGWQSAFDNALAAAGVNIFFVPSIFQDPATFKNIGFMDGELNWNSAWPMGDYEISTDVDWNYINQMGTKHYMAAISPFFFTHFGANSWNKNWLYRSDNWLYATRWEQLIAMRSTVKSLEILTWNDYGESSYIGPITGALPYGSDVWVNGFDHEAINVLTKYYSTAFKTGVYPTITKDSIVMWQRPHPHDATALNDGAGRPTGWQWTDDNLYAVVLTTGPATVTLTSGSNTQTFNVQGGLTKLKIPSSAGSISGSIVRSGSTVASYTSPYAVYYNSPITYNFNYFLGGSS